MPTQLPPRARVSPAERRTILAILAASALLTLAVGAVTPTTTLNLISQAGAALAAA